MSRWPQFNNKFRTRTVAEVDVEWPFCLIGIAPTSSVVWRRSTHITISRQMRAYFLALLWRHYIALYCFSTAAVQPLTNKSEPDSRPKLVCAIPCWALRVNRTLVPLYAEARSAARPEGPSTMQAHVDRPEAPKSKTGSKPAGKDDLQTLPLAEVEKKLGSSSNGLTQAEAQKRVIRYGPNEIAEKKTNEILKFLSYFWGPIPWMIEAAVILSAAARHWPDFGIILLLLANAMVGFWEEHQAGNAIAALKATLAIKARVKRDGQWVNPAARELVPGHAIRLRLGDIVPADARLLDGDEISVDQSALTGESLPATRKLGDAVFSGSIVRRGEIDALVYATGGKTYFGKTAELVETAVAVSHFQKAVLKIAIT